MDLDKDIMEFKDESNFNLKITPNFYIHMGILMAQKTLMYSTQNDKLNDGIIAYKIFIEHIEVLCRAAKYLGEDYKTDLDKFKETNEFKEADKGIIQMAMLSNKKLELLMKEVFKRSPNTTALQTGKAKTTETEDE